METRIELNGRDQGITFSAAHIIPRHGKCGHLHGHNYAVHVRLNGETGAGGIMFDFISLKDTLRSIITDLEDTFFDSLEHDLSKDLTLIHEQIQQSE